MTLSGNYVGADPPDPVLVAPVAAVEHVGVLAARVATLETALRDTCREYETRVTARLDHLLPGHTAECDEAWTSGACLRCDVMAGVAVSFGFARPLDSALDEAGAR